MATEKEEGENGCIVKWRYAVCLKCRAKTDSFHTEQEAIEAWNRRI
jgi:hypothetical protein